MEKKNLYLVKSRAFRGYVVASDTDEAWKKFKEYLENLGINGNSYGCYSDREFQSVTIVATTDSVRPKSDTGTSYDDNNIDDILIL